MESDDNVELGESAPSVHSSSSNGGWGSRVSKVLSLVAKWLHLRALVPYLLITVYSLLGGLMFLYLEKDFEREAKQEEKLKLEAARGNFTESLKNLMLVANLLPNFDTEEHLKQMIDTYEESVGFSFSEEPKWNLVNGIFYSATIYTTIGYGNIACSTFSGQICTIFYAIIGIPLALNTLNDLGQLLLKLIKKISDAVVFILTCYCVQIAKLRKERKAQIAPGRLVFTKEGEIVHEVELALMSAGGDPTAPVGHVEVKVESQSEGNPPVLAAVVATVGWLFISAGIFCIWETNWSFWTSFYFVFVSVSTIGFGDILPEHPEFMIMNFGSVMAGLALISVCINVVQAKLEDMYMSLLQMILGEYMEAMASGQGQMSASMGMMGLWKNNPKAKLLLPLLGKSKKAMVMQKFQEEAKAQGIEIPSILQDIDPTSGLPSILKAENVSDVGQIVEKDREERELQKAVRAATLIDAEVQVSPDVSDAIAQVQQVLKEMGSQIGHIHLLCEAGSQAGINVSVTGSQTVSSAMGLREALSQTDLFQQRHSEIQTFSSCLNLQESTSQTRRLKQQTEGVQTRSSFFTLREAESQSELTPTVQSAMQTVTKDTSHSASQSDVAEQRDSVGQTNISLFQQAHVSTETLYTETSDMGAQAGTATSDLCNIRTQTRQLTTSTAELQIGASRDQLVEMSSQAQANFSHIEVQTGQLGQESAESQTKISWYRRQEQPSQTSPLVEEKLETFDRESQAVVETVDIAAQKFGVKMINAESQTMELQAILHKIQSRRDSKREKFRRSAAVSDSDASDTEAAKPKPKTEFEWNPFDGRHVEKQKPVKDLKAKFEAKKREKTPDDDDDRRRSD